MASSDTSYFSDYLGSLWDAAAAANSDPEYTTPRTSKTATMNAVQAAQPIEADDGGSWSSWIKGVGTSLVNYAVVKDITQTQASAQIQQQQAAGQVAANAAIAQRAGGLTVSPGLLMLLGVGALVFVVARKV